MNARRRRGGFTLVEVLAAMVFMGILIPVLVNALSAANRASLAGERATTAAQLGENKLNELMLNDAWSSGETRGDFGDDYPGYHWELDNISWTQSTELTELTMVVYYPLQGQEHTVQLGTLAAPATTSQ